MQSIIEEIELCSNEYEMSTGFRPSRVYLGRQETQRLIQYAFDLGLRDTTTLEVGEWENMYRPEVYGLKVYMVNDSNPHMRCCM
jgi:hypothetical protein